MSDSCGTDCSLFPWDDYLKNFFLSYSPDPYHLEKETEAVQDFDSRGGRVSDLRIFALLKEYEWPIPSTNDIPDGLSPELASLVENALQGAHKQETNLNLNQNVNFVLSMRKGTCKLLAENPKSDLKDEVYAFIVKNWGGIDNANLRGIDQELEKHLKAGVSSWSKVAAAENPNKYFVYDSSVSWALNKIFEQPHKGKATTLYFPIVPGKQDAKAKEHIKIYQTKRKSFKFIYESYCKLLIKVCKDINAFFKAHGKSETFEPQLLEMALFIFGQHLRKEAKERKK